MKKIMIFVPFMTGYGGTERVISNLFTEYNKTNNDEYQMSLSSIGGTDNSNWLDAIHEKNVINLSKDKLVRKGQYLASLFFVLNKQILKNKPDVVISNSYIMWFCLMTLKRVFGYKYKVLAWYHFSLDSHKVPEMFLRAADGYLVISTGIKKQLENRGIPDDKISVIYNPIVKVDKSIVRTSNNEPVKFLYIGRIMLNGQKNIHEMFDALQNVQGNWHLDVYGVGDIAEAKDYVTKLGLEDKISFKGFSNNVWQEFDECDALILTSTFEGLPMVLNEAISHGIPVVSSNCDTGPEDIVTKENGYLYPLGDKKALTNILQKFVNRETNFNDTSEIKASISKFYSDNYFDVFMKAIKKYMG
ncbi:glycosyltransferase [Fructilactobacillus sp. Tb1]|uniref:glycosyltransferase n=1 Tax=Fructilactobacillus sp. Tb1 TaxID=3422304 RepID=UPI003D2DD743